MIRRAACFVSCLLAAAPAVAQLYATSGGGGTDSQSLFALDPANGAATLIGTPDFGPPGEPLAAGLPGADFAPDGSLYVVTSDQNDDPLDNALARIDPMTGAVIQVIGELTSSFDARDIAIHPQTGAIYASYSNGGPLVSIDSGTAAVSPIGGTDIYGPLAFSSNGTLYMAEMNPNLPAALYTVDTATGAQTLVAPLTRYYMALGRGPDGMLYAADFEGNGQWGDAGGTFGDIYRIHPTTGQETFLGSNPGVIIHDIASPAAPALTIPILSSAGLALLSLGLLALGLRRLRP